MIDTTGTLVNLLRADLAVVAIVGSRVRGGEPAAGDKPPMVIVSRMTTNRDPAGSSSRRIGLQEDLIQVKAYGVTRIQAAQLYGACSDALHMHPPFTDVSSRTIFTIADDVGTSSGRDPGTDWPYEDSTIRVIAAAGQAA